MSSSPRPPLAGFLYNSSSPSGSGFPEKRKEERRDSIFLAMGLGRGNTWLTYHSLDWANVLATSAC